MAARFPLEVVIQGIDRLTEPVKRAQERVAKALEPVRRLNNSLAGLHEAAGLGKLGDAFGKLRDRVGDVGRAARDVVLRLAAIGGIAAGAIAAVVGGTTKKAAELVRLSEKLGVSIGALQEYRFAAKLANVEDGALETGLGKLSIELGKAAKGTGAGAAAFRALKIHIRSADGDLRSVEDLLPEIADKLNALQDPGLRSARMVALFGKAALNLNPLLKAGSSGLATMTARARSLGLVMSDQAVIAAEQFGDTWDTLTAVLESARDTVGIALIPIVKELSEEFTNFVVANKPALQAFAQDLARELPGTLREIRGFLVDLGAALRPVVDLGRALANTFGGANVALAALAILIGGKLAVSLALAVPALVELGTLLVTTVIPGLVGAVPAALSFAITLMSAAVPAVWAFTVALLANPMTWVVVGIVALIAAVVLLWKNWSKVTAFLTRAWGAIRDAFASAFGWIIDNMPWVLGPVGLLIRNWDKVRAILLPVWEAIRRAFAAAFGWIVEKVPWVLGPVFLLIRNWDHVRGFLAGAWEAIRSSFESAFGWIVEKVPWVLGPVALIMRHWDRLGDFFTDLWAGIRTAFSEAIAWIAEKMAAVNALIPDWVRDVVGAPKSTLLGPAASAAARPPETLGQSTAAVRVDFTNMPRGTRVSPVEDKGVDLDLSLGYAMGSS